MKIGAMLIGALAASSVLAAGPALARPRLANRPGNIEWRIQQGVRNGSLTRHEAHRLQRRLRRVERIGYSYRRNGLSRWERRDLQRRYDRLSTSVRHKRHNAQYSYRHYWRR